LLAIDPWHRKASRSMPPLSAERAWEVILDVGVMTAADAVQGRREAPGRRFSLG
jgi:hypothetical protein